MKWEIEIIIEIYIITMNYHQLQIEFDCEYIWMSLKWDNDDEDELESNEENEIYDRIIIHNNKIIWNWYDRKNLWISMEMIKRYDKVSNK